MRRLLWLLCLVTATVCAQPPAGVAELLDDPKPLGSGEMRWFGLKLYDATLWASGGQYRAEGGFALSLRYARDFDGVRLARASIDEIRRLGERDEGKLARWQSVLESVFPNVKAGEVITGVKRADGKDHLPLPPLRILSVSLGGTEVAIDPGASRAGSLLPKQVVLRQNVPNPFNPSTTISFTLPESQDGRSETRLRLAIYNLRGSRVALLADGLYPAGIHRLVWDGTDEAGRPLSSGVYFYRLRVSGRVMTRKMILLK